MTTEMTVVNPIEFGIEEKQAKNLTLGLTVTLEEREVLKNAFLDVIDLEITEDNLSTFKDLRLKLVKNRTQGFDKWKKTQKAYFLAGGNFFQAIYNKEIAINEDMESRLMAAEKHFENLEKERVLKLNNERKEMLLPFIEDVENLTLSDMDEDVWNAYFSTKKQQFEDKKAAEEKAEKERIEAERIEAERIKAQEIENAKLKAEAEAREKEIEAERRKNAEIQAKKDAEAKAERDRIEAENKKKLEAERLEREKLEKELKAKADAERLAIEKAKADELKAKKAAEKLAKAPIKKKLQNFVDSFQNEIPDDLRDNAIANDILTKFWSFKKWANSEIEKL